MNYIIILLFFASGAFGQTILTENFNDFMPDTSGLKVYSHNFYSANPAIDLSTYGNNFTASGFSANFADETVSGNPMQKDSTAIKFNGSSEYFTIANASATDFVMADGQDYTWAFTFYMDNSYTGTVAAINNHLYFRLSNSGFDGVGIYSSWYDGTDSYVKYKNTALYAVSQWSTLIVVWDDDVGVTFYINGVEIASMTTSGTFANIGEVFATGDFYVGRIQAGQYFSNTLAHSIFSNSAWDSKKIKEYARLAAGAGWVSKNGNVVRNLNTPEWFQTFYDTIGIAIPSTQTLGSTQEFKLSVRAKSSDSNKTLKAWIGRSDYAKTEVQTQTVTSSWTTYNFNLGNGASLSTADTLWFSTNSLADTVSIDNVTLSKGQHNLYTRIGKRLSW